MLIYVIKKRIFERVNEAIRNNNHGTEEFPTYYFSRTYINVIYLTSDFTTIVAP